MLAAVSGLAYALGSLLKVRVFYAQVSEMHGVDRLGLSDSTARRRLR